MENPLRNTRSTMNTAILTLALAAGLSTSAMAAEFKGYIIDQKCSLRPDMPGDMACATKCIKEGSPAVLLTQAGKIYKIANQASVIPLAGKQVTITGAATGDIITVTSIKQ